MRSTQVSLITSETHSFQKNLNLTLMAPPSSLLLLPLPPSFPPPSLPPPSPSHCQCVGLSAHQVQHNVSRSASVCNSLPGTAMTASLRNLVIFTPFDLLCLLNGLDKREGSGSDRSTPYLLIPPYPLPHPTSNTTPSTHISHPIPTYPYHIPTDPIPYPLYSTPYPLSIPYPHTPSQWSY